MSGLPPRDAGFGPSVDRFGLAHGSDDAEALAAFGDATEGVAAYRRDIMASVDRALAADPAMTAAYALKGLLLLLAARAETVAAARKVRLAMPPPRTEDETALAGALAEGVARGTRAAAAVLGRHLARRPDLLLFVKLATMLHFVGGDARAMRALTAAVLPAWSAALPGYGYVLGCHAFGLEEAGEYAAAERAGRAAVELAPYDAWAVHAVAHVYEMTHRPADGVAWIEQARPAWRDCNSFAFHLSWHLALFHLDQGRPGRVLALYDAEIRPDRSEDSRDYTNAVSLLWRLRQHGVAVGDRWRELADIAGRRRGETTLVFAALHRLLALIAAGEADAARAAAAALQAAGTGANEQAAVAATIGAPLANALLNVLGDDAAPRLTGLATALGPLGGSHAQRDLFVRSLALLAGRSGDRAALAAVMAVRRRLRHDDSFTGLLAAVPA